jgi:hypothetical protein
MKNIRKKVMEKANQGSLKMGKMKISLMIAWMEAGYHHH